MNIKSFYLSGYKNIFSTNIELFNVTALMSLNSKGKSNLLKGLFFCLKLFNLNPFDRDKYFLFSKKMSKPLNKNTFDNPYELKILGETNVDNKKVDIEYFIRLDWTCENGIKIIDEILKIKPDDSERFTVFYERKNNDVKYKKYEKRGCDVLDKIMNNEMIFDFYINKNIYYQPIIEKLKNISFVIDRHFDNSSTYESVTENYNDNEFSFCGNKKENTPENLYLLKVFHKSYYDRIIFAMKTLFDDLIDLDVEKIAVNPNIIGNRNYYQLYAKQKSIDAYINCSEMSDGFKRVLNNLIFLSICEIKNVTIVALEEPENSVNPTVFGKYIQIIAEFAESYKIIFTSHSPFLLQYMPLNHVFIALENNAGNTFFKHIKQTYIKRITEKSNRLNVLTGTYIFDVLSNESNLDKEMLKEALDIDE